MLTELNIKTVSDVTIGKYNISVLKHYRQALREYNEIRFIFEQNPEEPSADSG